MAHKWALLKNVTLKKSVKSHEQLANKGCGQLARVGRNGEALTHAPVRGSVVLPKAGDCAAEGGSLSANSFSNAPKPSKQRTAETLKAKNNGVSLRVEVDALHPLWQQRIIQGKQGGSGHIADCAAKLALSSHPTSVNILRPASGFGPPEHWRNRATKET